MTDVGEKVAVTRIKQEDDPEYHFSALQICFPSGKPFITSSNIVINTVIDDYERPDQANFDACVNKSLLAPGTKVEFKVEETIDDEIAETRREIQAALDVIIDKELEQKEIENATLKDSNLAMQGLIITGAFMSGVKDGALSLFEFAGDTAEFVYDATWYNFQVTVVNNLEAAWETAYKKGDVIDYFDSVKQKDIEDFAKAFGRTPQELAEQIAEAYYILNFIYNDDPTQAMLKQFAIDYAGAQSITEMASMAGSAAFDIILGAVLAVTTGGAGNVAQAAQLGAKVRHFASFQKLAQILRKLVGQLERRLAKKSLPGKLDKKIEHKITPPDAQKIKPERSRKPARNRPLTDSKDNKQIDSLNQAEQADSASSISSQDTSSPDKSSPASSAGNSAPQESTASGKNKQGNTCPPDSLTCTSGEPISLVTGEEMLTLQEFSLPGPLTLTWSRTYKSSNPDNIGLGYGWTHSFAEKIEIKDSRLLVHTAEARTIEFAVPTLGAKSSNTAEKLQVYRSGEDRFELSSTEPGQSINKRFERPRNSAAFLLSRIYDQYDNGFDFVYKGSNLTQIRAQYGDHWQFEYNEQNLLSAITRYNSQGSSKALAEFLYDQYNDLIEAFDSNGNSEQYAYHNHLIQQRTLKSGYRFYFKWDGTDHNARCLEQWGDLINGKATYHYKFSWDTQNRTAQTTDTRGGVEVYQFNERGLPIYHRDAEGGVTTTQYDELGNVISIKNANGHFKYFTYDESQRLIIFADAANNKHEIKRNSRGLITDVFDPLGQKSSRRYDDKGALISQTNPLGESLSFAYNDMGLLRSVSNAAGQQWQYIWDNKAQLTAIRSPNGKHTRYSYNSDGLLKKITYPDNKTSQYEYDDAGNCIYLEQPNGSTQRFEYNSLGLVTKATDQAGRTTHYAYNGLSQVVRKIDPAGFVLHYHYDGERNLIGLTNQNGEHYRLKYDLNERLIEEIGFDGRIQNYVYDAEGYLIGKADLSRDGKQALNKIAFKRDANGRLLQQAQLTEQGPRLLNQFSYDPLGRMTTAQNAQRNLKWVYDPLGRILEEHQDQHIIRHHYAKGGGRTATSLPDGQTIGYEFDDDGLFSALYFDQQCVAKIERDQSGQEITRSHSNKLNTESRYDPQGRLIAQRTGKYRDNNSFKSLSQRRLQYNEQGLISQIDDTLRGQTRYHYDAVDRLTKVGGPNPENFIHDPAGNLLATQTPDNVAQPAQAQGNRLSFYGDQHFSYDELGNLSTIRRGKNQALLTQYQYDALNQLASVKQQDNSTHYRYDPLGRRIAKTDGANTTEFLWLGDVLLSENTKQANNVQTQKTYLFEPGSFKPLAFVQDKKIYHYHLDHLGTPQEITNEQGKLVWAVTYRAYGNLAVAHKNEIENNLRFQGQYYDEESGLHYNRFRYYDPECGRFINQDPIGLLGGVNNYQYVPNPVDWVDPLGLICKEKKTAAEESASYQGTDPYFGVDKLENIELKKGDKIVHITYKHDGGIAGNYFTTLEALESARAKDGLVSARALNQGLQVYAGDGRTNYKEYVNVFEVVEDIPFGGAAKGPTKANPQFNPGRYKTHDQYFVLDEHLDKLRPAPGKLETMKDTNAPDLTDKLNKLRGD